MRHQKTPIAVGAKTSRVSYLVLPAITTVMTTVTRLYEKGLLDRARDGKRYLYSPKVSREDFLESTAREVLDRSIGSHQAIAMLAEKVSEASAGELDELEALIQKRREELEA